MGCKKKQKCSHNSMTALVLLLNNVKAGEVCCPRTQQQSSLMERFRLTLPTNYYHIL